MSYYTPFQPTAEVVAHSVHGSTELVSVLMTYPRFIHPQMLRHRSFAHSAQSSRAVSLKRSIAWLEEHGPVMPIFTREQKGMQEGAAFTERDTQLMYATRYWAAAANHAVLHANDMADHNVHHSVCNRILEPFLPIAHLMTGTRDGWQYLLRLRLDAHADVHAQALARAIDAALAASEAQPTTLHLPFDGPADAIHCRSDRMLLSISRCARISYLNYDGPTEPEKEWPFVRRLWESEHYSPFEHIAQGGFKFADVGGSPPRQIFQPDWVSARHSAVIDTFIDEHDEHEPITFQST